MIPALAKHESNNRFRDQTHNWQGRKFKISTHMIPQVQHSPCKCQISPIQGITSMYDILERTTKKLFIQMLLQHNPHYSWIPGAAAEKVVYLYIITISGN
jgi:hypothetical protein